MCGPSSGAVATTWARKTSIGWRRSVLGAALGNDEGALPVVAAVDGDDEVARRDPGQGRVLAARVATDPKPEHVDRRADVLDRQAGGGAHGRAPAVAADRAVGVDLERSLGRTAAHTADAAVAFGQQPGHVGLHAELEGGQLLRLADEEVEKLPLRHHGDEGVALGQAAEVAELDRLAAEDAAQRPQTLVRPLQEGFEQAELVHDAQRRRMHRVAAEVAQEVGVLLEHHRRHAGAGQQEAQHHAGRAAADDAAAGGGDRGRAAHRRPLPRRPGVG